MLQILKRIVPRDLGVDKSQRRFLWLWLNKMFNAVDKERLKEIGPNRACAEWLLRNGAAVRWAGDNNLLKDYNTLSGYSMEIAEIDASDSSISHYGFKHLQGCKRIERITLHKCGYIEDEAINNLKFIDSPIKYIRISSCFDITDKGLKSFPHLPTLQELVLYDLPSVKNLSECKDHLRSVLKNCKITEEIV